jgi:hypothetical protein
LHDFKPVSDFEKLENDVEALLEELEKINELLCVPSSMFRYSLNWKGFKPKFKAPNFIECLRKQRLTYEVLDKKFSGKCINIVMTCLCFLFGIFVANHLNNLVALNVFLFSITNFKKSNMNSNSFPN